MKRLLLSLVLLYSLSVSAGIPYLIQPTNAPELVGQQLFSVGNGYSWWDWSTNAASSNSTVVSASTSVGVTTNGFNFTPFLSAGVTNWVNAQDTVVSNGVYGLFNGGTNIDFGYSRTIGGLATNNDTVVSNGVFTLLNIGTNDSFSYARSVIGVGATNQDLKTSNTLWLMITNVYVDVGGNGGTTNRSGQNVTYTVVPGAGGSGTGIQTNNGTGTNNVFTGPILVGSTTSSNAFFTQYGTTPVLQSRTNGDLFITGTLNSTNFVGPTNAPTDAYVLTATGTAGFTKWAAAAGGSGTGIQTNGGTGTNNIFSGPIVANGVFTNKAQRLFNSTTNGFMPAINAMDYGLATGSDMTAVLQAAINDASEGQRVFIPAGDWTVNGTLIISNRPIILEGEAEVGSSGIHQGTMLDIAAGANNALVIYPACAGTIVRNIQFYANAPSQNCYAIGITNESTFLSSFTFQGLTIHGFGTGIKLLNCGLGVIDNCYFNNVGTGIWASNAVNAIKVTQSHFQCTNGIAIYGTSTACINWDISSWFEVCVTSILLNGTVQKVNVHDGYFEGNTNNVVATGVKSLTVRDNYIQGLNNTNLVFVGVTNSIVEGNLFANATPMWHVDSTSTVFHQRNNLYNGGTYVQSPSTSVTVNTNITVVGGSYYGPSILGGGQSQLADTNWVIAQVSSLGANVYSSGVTNAIVMTNNAAGETGYRTNIWQGQVSVPTVITTNTINMVTATAGTYVRHYVSTNKYTTIAAGPVTVVSYLFRSGAAGTVSGHYEIYAVDSVSGQMTELTSSTTHTISETVPTLHQFTMSVPADYTPANQLYMAVAFKLDTVVNGQTFNFVSGSNYDGHISFARPLSSATITSSQIAGTLTNPYYTTNGIQTILTPATATNTMPLYGGVWRLIISTPAAITNLTGPADGYYTYASLILSNSLATTLTNWLTIPAVAKGYDATNSAATLGINGYVIGAGKEVELLLSCEGINRTNWMLIRE